MGNELDEQLAIRTFDRCVDLATQVLNGEDVTASLGIGESRLVALIIYKDLDALHKSTYEKAEDKENFEDMVFNFLMYLDKHLEPTEVCGYISIITRCIRFGVGKFANRPGFHPFAVKYRNFLRRLVLSRSR